MFQRRLDSTFGASDTAEIRFQGRFILANPCVEFIPEFVPTLKSCSIFPVVQIRSDCPSNIGFRGLKIRANPSSATIDVMLKSPAS